MNDPAARRAPKQPAILAAIDMGSNSFRLEIAQLDRGHYRRIDYLKETVRLGAGLDAEGHLTEGAMLRGLECLERFAHRLQGVAAWQVRAVATQTLREARNRDAFLERARQTLGFDIEVISGREEARLIFAGVARLQPSSLPRLVIDIGGRSTELIVGQGRHPRAAESFQVGSVSLSLRYFEEGRFTPEAFRAAQIAAGAAFEESMGTFAPRHWQEALGASGTVSAISQVLQANGVTDGTITPAALRWCIEYCVAAQHHERLNWAGLRPDRRAIMGGGLSILYTLATHFGIEQLVPARGALRQGVIYELSERRYGASVDHHAPLDLRASSVLALQERFGVDRPQAQRVQTLALALCTALPAECSQRQPEAKLALAWAAALHEVGMMVSHHDHHRHSAYLIRHVDAAGFSQSQQQRLSDLVLAQRGGLRKVQAALQDPQFLWQVLCLRLAIVLCHARVDVPTDAAHLRVKGRTATLKLHKTWAQTHPRAWFLLTEEANAWARTTELRLILAAT